MDFFTGLKIASTGLSVQRTRMNVTASNLANVETTRTADGGAYKKRSAVVSAVPLSESFDEVFGDALHDRRFYSRFAYESQVLARHPKHPPASTYEVPVRHL